MKLTMLGTGNAMVTEYYNTCFVLSENNAHFMVDGGGGNGLMTQLKRIHLRIPEIRDIFVSHQHLDHITGIFWVLRVLLQGASRGMQFDTVHIYSHAGVIHILDVMVHELLDEKCCAQLGKAVELITVEDGEHRTIMGHDVVFFDIGASKAKQFGFRMNMEEKSLVFLGDEPYMPSSEPYVKGTDWCMHEAFCMDREGEIFHPERIRHSTVRKACETMEALQVRNLILYHTEESHLSDRKELYTEEGNRYFSGHLYVPEDLETIEL